MRFLSSAAWISVCWCAVLISGCANNPRAFSPSDGKTDILTESDEPDVRRRARLRLELASGYFEQGQTNVALDELKQALILDPSFGDAYNLRGLVYMRLNDLPLAEDSFRRASQLFGQAIANPGYTGQAKTLMAQGVCQIRASQPAEAEQSFLRSYQIDARNPLTAYNLANLLYERGDLTRAQFYIRNLNNSELANAETLWLGIKIEQRLNNREVVAQLGDQLKKRYGQSREAGSYEKGAFNE
jgi:type IV pilus assembly protein PilF